MHTQTIVIVAFTSVPAIAALLWSDDICRQRIDDHRIEGDQLRSELDAKDAELRKLRVKLRETEHALEEERRLLEKEQRLRAEADLKALPRSLREQVAKSKLGDVSIGTPLVLGALDASWIKRIAEEHVAQVRHCHERELARNPQVEGKIVIKSVINGDGRVALAEVAESSMKNTNVESCLSAMIRTWIFPRPLGGGIVIVNQPFRFRSATDVHIIAGPGLVE